MRADVNNYLKDICSLFNMQSINKFRKLNLPPKHTESSPFYLPLPHLFQIHFLFLFLLLSAMPPYNFFPIPQEEWSL